MTADLFSQRPRTLRGNKRIKRLSGPPAWRMMRQGKSPPEKPIKPLCGTVRPFQLSSQRAGEEMKERGMKLPFTEPCGNGLLRFNNWDGTQLSSTKGGKKIEERRVKERGGKARKEKTAA